MPALILAAMIVSAAPSAVDPIDPITRECREIYSQKRFDQLKDKDHAIAVCAQAKAYYRH
jgi:hypothetical protein